MNKNFILSFNLFLITCSSYGMELAVPKQTTFKKRQVKLVETKKVIKKNSLTNQEKAIEERLKNFNELCKSLDDQPLQEEYIDSKRKKTIPSEKLFVEKKPTQHLGTPMPKAINKKNTPGTRLIAYQKAINQKNHSTAIKILPTLNSYEDQTILNKLAKSTPKQIPFPFTNNETWNNHSTDPINKENFETFTLYFIDEKIKQAKSDQEQQNLNAIKKHLEEELTFYSFF